VVGLGLLLKIRPNANEDRAPCGAFDPPRIMSEGISLMSSNPPDQTAPRREAVQRPAWLLPTPPRRDEVGRAAAGDADLRELTLRLMRGENLQRTDAAALLTALLSPAATDAQIAGALTALAIKGETAEELAGMAEAMRARAVRLDAAQGKFIDTAGTGSSQVKTFNVSTAAAFVIAGAGLPVAKHGSRAATSNSGSADVLEALGVNTAARPEIMKRCLDEHGICFMFAPLFHGSTARVAHVRRELGVHTTFNLLGPLTNPARAPFQLVGVWHRSLLEPVACALRALGSRAAWVVHGSDGLDEITIAGETHVAATGASGNLRSFTIEPKDFGVERASLEKLRGGTPADNATLIRAVFSGSRDKPGSTARDLVAANAAAALVIAGVAIDLATGAQLAFESIDSGRAAAKLEALVKASNSWK
jgi:anthranilate phosphoribosyltransferase